MGYRLSKITTRTGDQGTTGLATGDRVSKASARIVAIGAVDELNSWIGVLLAQPLPSQIAAELLEVQHDLFEAGAQLSLPGQQRLSVERVAALEAVIAEMNGRLEPLREFILPGGSQASSLTHVARSVCRRAETAVVSLSALEPVGEHLMPYLNRLSDFLFVAARLINRESGTPETQWRNKRTLKR